ncbi:hypothetical protein D5086_030199 [Populus alba]|uniref:Uncharacterized protein n=1 Tax=Populus alba TaxID=43335 RepID=A0ACC4AMV7_POPAL
MEPSSSSVYSTQFLSKRVTVEFIIVKESQAGLQIFLMGLKLRLQDALTCSIAIALSSGYPRVLLALCVALSCQLVDSRTKICCL